MNCYSPVRLFIDGEYMWLDSILFNAGENRVFSFSADGRTWRLEADQHPLHPGNSHPNASIEACGNRDNWIPNLITILPQDDADAVKDIYCGVVTGSYDPNDKTGYPLGIGSSHLILPNGQIEYLIRFQNTGTDTAFTVVIRDTLDTDLNIFSVQAGVSSHNYSFRMYGQRVLEWTYSNILLPDSTTNEIESHGFATFTVNQNPNLIDSTEITNNVGIYFDFNSPVITNTTSHKIGRGIYGNDKINQTVDIESCIEFEYNSIQYNQSGTYYQVLDGGNNQDTLLSLNLQINYPSTSSLIESACNSYTASDNQVYTQSGTYTAIISSSQGCDSTITIDLTIKNPSSSNITESACNSYNAPDNQVYTQSGTYTAIIPNSQSCDSIITVNLTVNNLESTTSINNFIISSEINDGVYQWFDCLNNNEIIQGATSQTFTVEANGEFAVVVSKNNCIDTSECILVSNVGLKTFSNSTITINPNPTSSFLTVSFGEKALSGNCKVYSLSGQVIENRNFTNKENIEIETQNYSKGMYFLELDFDGSNEIFKFIKE